MKYKLTKRAENNVKTTFFVENSAGDVVGSINVQNAEVPDLLRCWSGPQGPFQPKSTNLSAGAQSPVSALAKEFLKHRRPVSQANILRGCMG
jgi:hypothetical protein